MQTGGDLVVQPACISFQLNFDSPNSGSTSVDLELNVMPMELSYRDRTLSNLISLSTALGDSNNHRSKDYIGDNAEDQRHPVNLTAVCTLSSFTILIPSLREHDFSRLYTRCGQSSSGDSSTSSAIVFMCEEVALEHKNVDRETGAQAGSWWSLECKNFLFYASSPQFSSVSVGRSRQLDILAATGRFEVEPAIPIALEYRSNTSPKELNKGISAAKAMFPAVPPFSSFKARQEDEDEDEETDRILSGKFGNVNLETKTSLRSAKDPQGEMISESEKANALVQIHIPEIVVDLSREELLDLLQLVSCCMPPTGNSETAKHSDSPSTSVAISLAFDSISCSMVNERELNGSAMWSSHLVKLDRCRAHTTVAGGRAQFLRLLSHETTLFHCKESLVCRDVDSSRCTILLILLTFSSSL
jgi:hypothetical protein